ncbi:MAG: FixH family protein [Chloroflexi bacterium]|nr:FixH family protein [Chloroflexota bacterium]
MRTPTLISVLLVLPLLLAACIGSAGPEPAPVSSSIVVTAETNPNPATMGNVEIILTITDEAGNPVTGATVMVTADHTDMSGMSMTGQATEQSNGAYAIQANFVMSGNWMLKVEVKQGSQSVIQEIPLVIK